MEETFEFKADGTGHNENALLSYDFKYDIDGDQLNIYAQLFGMDSEKQWRIPIPLAVMY